MNASKNQSDGRLRTWSKGFAVLGALGLVLGTPVESAAAGQSELREWVRAAVKAGYVDLPEINIIIDNNFIIIDVSYYGIRSYKSEVRNQLKVEAVRNWLARQDKDMRAFWEPYLGKAERIIQDQLVKEGESYDSTLPYEERNRYFVGHDENYYDFLINSLLERAVVELASQLGKELSGSGIRPERMLPRSVVLATPDGKGTILIVPKTLYLIAVRLGEPPPFVSVASGAITSCRGVYAYKIRDNRGIESEVKYVQIDREGRFEVR